MSPTATTWNDYSAPLRALFDEYARAIRDLESVVHSITPEKYTASNPLSDSDYPDLKTIMRHVVGAAHVYVDYIDDGLTERESGRREHAMRLDSPADAMGSVWEAFDRMVERMRPVKEYTEEQMEKVHMVTRWHERFNIEQMMEHAIVHILRHRRQIERWLASW